MSLSKTRRRYPGRGLFFALLALLFLVPRAQAAAEISVQAQVASREVYIGQPFTLQLEITGAEASEQPPLTLADFRVEPQGTSNRSQSYQITINGRLQTTKSSNYTHQYLLTAGKTGLLTIPAIPVTLNGTTYSTAPITMKVKEPTEIAEFKLRLTLSKERCYVGEAITMTTTWLIGQELQGFEFNLPIFSDPRFEFFAQPPATARGQKDLVELEVAGEKIIAEKKPLQQGGRNYVSLTFQHTLIPRSPGKISLPPASLAINAFEGYSQSRQDSFGMNPLVMFGSGRRKIYRTVVIPANPLDLEILPLPEQGRPPHFSGLVGQYSLSTEAAPTTVKVGDPISLTVRINGTFVDNLSLPPLEAALPGQDFKVASAKPQSSLSAGTKSFITTLRASHAEVTAIPGLSLAFFNPETREYEVARSEDIPLRVQPTRVIRAQDALGGPAQEESGPAPSAMISEARQDIRPNYAEIREAGPGKKGWLPYAALLLLPPLLFALFFFRDQYRHDDTRAARQRRRRAYRRLRQRLHSCGEEAFFESWLEFLGDKLDRPARTITRHDAVAGLSGHPEARELSREVEEIFSQGEAARYGGCGHVLEKERVLAVAKKIDEVL